MTSPRNATNIIKLQRENQLRQDKADNIICQSQWSSPSLFLKGWNGGSVLDRATKRDKFPIFCRLWSLFTLLLAGMDATQASLTSLVRRSLEEVYNFMRQGHKWQNRAVLPIIVETFFENKPATSGAVGKSNGSCFIGPLGCLLSQSTEQIKAINTWWIYWPIWALVNQVRKLVIRMAF